MVLAEKWVRVHLTCSTKERSGKRISGSTPQSAAAVVPTGPLFRYLARPFVPMNFGSPQLRVANGGRSAAMARGRRPMFVTLCLQRILRIYQVTAASASTRPAPKELLGKSRWKPTHSSARSSVSRSDWRMRRSALVKAIWRDSSGRTTKTQSPTTCGPPWMFQAQVPTAIPQASRNGRGHPEQLWFHSSRSINRDRTAARKPPALPIESSAPTENVAEKNRRAIVYGAALDPRFCGRFDKIPAAWVFSTISRGNSPSNLARRTAPAVVENMRPQIGGRDVVLFHRLVR